MTPELEAMHRLGVKFCWFNAEMDHDAKYQFRPPASMPVWLVEGERYQANFGPVFFTKHLWLPAWPTPLWPASDDTLTWRHPGTWVHLGLNYGCIETDRGFWVWPTEKRLAQLPPRLRRPSTLSP